eukprot:TRINITY_DN78399_c0_g1_i1.p1 TRINITY_DN78399_c0_g1~~TRINITY_DN78399_c0_g1_i1.p1  ORF type:complete len:308 (-),score=53.47 TRINITY_DN78399_c0_g1_i1:52-930(-)
MAEVLMKPPRLPVGHESAPAKRRPPPVLGLGCEADGPQSFSMCTPRGGPDDTTRHYIGTPRADSILSAFMDFGDVCGGEDQGPPLDFDDAFEAFQKHEKALEASKVADGVKAKADAGSASPGPLESSGASTRCSLSDDDECGGKSDEDMPEEADLAKQDEEASDYESDEEFYESDFEDYESEYESDEEEGLEPTAGPAEASQTQGRASSRTRAASGVRYRSSSRGGVGRDESRPRRRERSESRPGAPRRERSGSRTGRRRDPAQGAQRDRSLDRLRKAMAQPLRPMGIPPLP